ncbi:MAG: DNA-binding protein, partial [Nanoarchaeota archaeon]
QQQQAEGQQLAKQIEQLEAMVRPALSREALLRFGTLKSAHPEKAIRALVALAQAVGKGVTSIDDAQLRALLVSLEPQQREIKINRR